jgi:glycosyltransferase involved in cell wall biosynthesis
METAMFTVVNLFGLRPTKPSTLAPGQQFIATKLRASGGRLTLMTCSSPYDDLFRTYQTEDFNVHIVPSEEAHGLKLVAYILRYLRTNAVTILHIQFMDSVYAILLVAGAKLLRIRTEFVYHKQSAGRMIRRRFSFKRYVNPLSLVSLLVARTVCVSQAIVENCVNRGVRRSKTLKIFNAVVVERFANVRATGRIRADLGIPSDHQIVTAIKEARPETGVRDLVLAIPEVIRACPKTTFLIVGGGDGTEGLRALAVELGVDAHIRFTGIRTDIPEVLAESAFTVDPSPVEACGNVLIESMAASKPVVGVNAWGNTEIVVDGETGFLVAAGSPTLFGPRIVELLSSPAKTEAMGKASFERANATFSNAARAAALVRLWAELARGVADTDSSPSGADRLSAQHNVKGRRLGRTV